MSSPMRLFLLISLAFTATDMRANPVFITSSEAVFSQPHDLALAPDGETLYVADVKNHIIQALHPDTLQVIGRIGEGELDSPHDLTFDELGRMLVADSGHDRIVIYEVNRLRFRVVGELSHRLDSPEGVTTAEGQVVYVTNTGNDRISMFKAGQFVKVVGGSGGSLGRFLRPHDIERGSDGLLYIGDPGNNRIQIMAADLTPVGILSKTDKPFREPKYLALDLKNNLYVADQNNNQLRIFDKSGVEIAFITEAGGKSLNNIEGVEVVDERIWVADTYNNRVVLFKWHALAKSRD